MVPDSNALPIPSRRMRVLIVHALAYTQQNDSFHAHSGNLLCPACASVLGGMEAPCRWGRMNSENRSETTGAACGAPLHNSGSVTPARAPLTAVLVSCKQVTHKLPCAHAIPTTQCCGDPLPATPSRDVEPRNFFRTVYNQEQIYKSCLPASTRALPRGSSAGQPQSRPPPCMALTHLWANCTTHQLLLQRMSLAHHPVVGPYAPPPRPCLLIKRGALPGKSPEAPECPDSQPL